MHSLSSDAEQHEKPRRRKRSQNEIRTRRLGLLLAAPAIVYVLVFLAFPLLYNLFLSVTDANGANLISQTFSFNNFENYSVVINDPAFWNALKLSVIFTVSCLFFQYTIGFALALFFRRPFPGNGIIRALLLVGWILPPVKWLTVGSTAMFAVVVANLWIGIPFNLLLLLSGLHTIDDGLYEAAAVDGASKWRQFVSITFPLMQPVSISVLLLGVINTYKVFDLIYTMTKGGPVDSTTTLPIYSYLETFKVFEFGNGAAASALTLLLPLALSWFYVKSLNEEDLK